MINFLPIFHNSPSPTEVIRSTLLMIMQHKYKQRRLHTHTHTQTLRWNQKKCRSRSNRNSKNGKKTIWSKQEEVQIVCLQFSLSLSHVCSTNINPSVFILWINSESWCHTDRKLHVPISASPWCVHVCSMWKLKHYFDLTEFAVTPDGSSSQSCADVWMCGLCKHYAIFYIEGQIVATHNDKLSAFRVCNPLLEHGDSPVGFKLFLINFPRYSFFFKICEHNVLNGTK